MKKITGLEDVLLSVSEEEDAEKKMPTYRRVFQIVIGNSKAKTADDSRRMARIGMKLRSTVGEIELDETDLKTLKESVESNQVNLTAWVQGQLLYRLDEIARG